MKKIRFLLLLSIALTTCLTGCAPNKNTAEVLRKSDTAVVNTIEDDSMQLVSDKDVLTVGVSTGVAPMCFRNTDGSLAGFEIDLANAVAEKLGVKAEFVLSGRDVLLDKLSVGSIDVAWSGIAVAPENESKVLLSKPYINNNTIAVTPLQSELKDIDELDDRRIGVFAPADNANVYYNKKSTIVKFTDYPKMFQALWDGKLDAVICDEASYDYYTHISGQKYNILSGYVKETAYAAATYQGKTALMLEIDSALSYLKEKGQLEALSLKWFGRNIYK